ncbi:MAG TPA: flagellar basal body P-ring formation chaperone FlgA [Nitrospirota bacterium]|nr:flagellar basal body P-ring formation chaperone FlgA [Nitrospirota bacterium]
MRNAEYNHIGLDAGIFRLLSILLPAVLLVSLTLWFLLILPAVAFAETWYPECELKTYLKKHYPWAEVDISDLRMSVLPPAERPADIVVEKAPPGRSVFRFEFRKNNSITVTAMIKTFDRIFMSRTAFRKDYVLRQDDIYPTLMETCRIPQGAVREENRLIGKPLVRSIIQNMPITDTMVSDTPIVKRGHPVFICVDSPGFSIKVAGETSQDAKVGDYVKAINLSSKKIVTGLLVDEDMIRVDY